MVGRIERHGADFGRVHHTPRHIGVPIGDVDAGFSVQNQILPQDGLIHLVEKGWIINGHADPMS